ncbi:MAG: terminase gpA endonuclease subunit [Planctomycetota bacterium]
MGAGSWRIFFALLLGLLAMISAAPTANAKIVYADALSKGLDLRPPCSIDEYANSYRHIAPGTSAREGKWDSDLVPLIRGVHEALEDPETEVVSLMKATQVFGTEAIINWFGHAHCEDPAPAMLVYPTQLKTRGVYNRRVRPALEASPRNAALLPRGVNELKGESPNLGTMVLHLRGAGTERDLESEAVKRVGVDELDRCVQQTPNVVGIVERRIDTYPGGMVFLVGSPGLAGQGISLEYQKSDQRRPAFACPHCGQFHHRESFTESVRWCKPGENPFRCSPEHIDAHAAFLCPDCGELISAAWNMRQHHQAVWIRKGELVESNGLITEVLAAARVGRGDTCLSRLGFRNLRTPGHPEAEAAWRDLGVKISGEPEVKSHARVGFHANGFCRTFQANPYAYIAKPFVDLHNTNGRIDENFVTRVIGDHWQEKGSSFTADELRTLVASGSGDASGDGPTFLVEPTAEPPAESDQYVRGTVSPSYCGVLIAIDVQKNRLPWEAVAVSPGMKDLALIAGGEIMGREIGDQLEGLDQLAEWRFYWPRTEDGWTGSRECPVLGVVIDSGHWQAEGFEATMRLRDLGIAGGEVLPAKGIGGDASAERRAWLSNEGTSRTGAAERYGLDVVHFNTDRYKDDLHRRLHAEKRAREQGVDLTRGVSPTRLRIPAGRESRLFDELAAEQRIVKQVRKKIAGTDIIDEVTIRKWVKKPGARHNHAFDCVCMALALGTVLEIDTANWEKFRT